MPSIASLKDLLVDELKDLYSAEQQLVKALPKMSKASSHENLKDSFNSHLEETHGHVQRLEEAFSWLGVPAKAKTCKAMQGLIAEGAEAIDLDATEMLRDACLIGAAQRVEHYEIAAYGTARAFASTIGEEEVADLLQETLNEEAAADRKLTFVAGAVNQEANCPRDESDGRPLSKRDERGRSR